MSKPAPPPTDMEALVRRSRTSAEASPPVDMAALVRRPAKAPKADEPEVNMEALVRRPAKAPKADEPEINMEALVRRPKESRKQPPVPREPVREATLKEYTDYVQARNNGFEGSMRDYYEAHLKPADRSASPDLESLVRRPKAAPPTPPCLETLVARRPTTVSGGSGAGAWSAPPDANARRNQLVKNLVESARKIEPSLVDGMRFNTRLHRFLDLRPTAWTTWGDDDARSIVQSASAQAEASRQLSLANAVKWAAECEQVYSRPPGFFDRFAQNAKPEFYQVRLEQARDILIKVQDDLQQVQDTLKTALERLRIDALVLQVATDKETDPSNQITATRRLQTLVQVQATGAMIIQGCETLAQSSAAQAATVSSLLTVTIPNWIMALKSR